jgi:hypothetical protein
MRRPDFAGVILLGFGIAGIVGSARCYDFSSVSGAAREGGSTGGDDATVSDAQGSTPSDSSSTDGFCASQAAPPQSTTRVFCDAFDEYDGSTLSAWDQALAYNGSVGLTSLSPFSPPSAMAAQTSIASMGETTEADVLKAFSEFATKNILITASFEMRIQQWDPATTGQIIAFEVIFKNSSAQFNQIALNLNSLGADAVSAQIAENATGVDGGPAGYYSYLFPSHPKTQDWTKVEMTVSAPDVMGADSNTVTVALDGVTQINAQALQAPLQGGTPYIHLGIGYVATPAMAWAVQYDNFLVTISQF